MSDKIPVLTAEIFDKLKLLAAKESLCDDPSAMIDDYAGGNIDDAYYKGANDGEISLAREILDKLGVSY